MLLRRESSTIAVVAALACVFTLLADASAAAPAKAAQKAAQKSAQKPAQTAGTTASATPLVPTAVMPKAAVGAPPVNAPIRAGSYFSYPNRTRSERVAIRKRVLNTIKSTWGGRRDGYGAALAGNGKIRIATWTLNDWAIARALYQAHRRGVSVQVMAAAGPNRTHKPWRWLRGRLHAALYRAGHPETMDRWSFARKCRGSCRGGGGTAHSKYFLFTNVGAAHVPAVTVQSSMNLTRLAYTGQWNQATVSWDRGVHSSFDTIFREARLDRPASGTYRRYTNGGIQSIFFPKPSTTSGSDPIMQALSTVRCLGATSGGDANRRTRIRVIQYAIYGTRGTWIAKRLRSLWNAGCNVRIVYAVSSRPVLSMLRSRSGRGPVPMKQSVIKNSSGEIVKYNHSKWMTITGSVGTSTGAWMVMPGSANWSNLALSSDEQMQQISSYGYTRAYLAAFEKTWKQRSSRPPRLARTTAGGRLLPTVPEQPVFGQGIYRYLPED